MHAIVICALVFDQVGDNYVIRYIPVRYSPMYSVQSAYVLDGAVRKWKLLCNTLNSSNIIVAAGPESDMITGEVGLSTIYFQTDNYFVFL